MTTDWLLRVGNGQNFIRSSKFNIWGINTLTGPFGKSFIKNVRNGDRMWFVTGDSNGKIIAVATYRSHNNRELGPLVNLTQSNADLGWTGGNWTSDTEVHYTDLYNLTECELLTLPFRKREQNFARFFITSWKKRHTFKELLQFENIIKIVGLSCQ